MAAVAALCALGCAQSRPPSELAPQDGGVADAADTAAWTEIETAYYRAQAEARCAAYARCCARAGLRTQDGCISVLEDSLRRWRPDPRSGARFDPEAAAECIEALGTVECAPGKMPQRDPPACARVYTPGTLPPGSPCTPDSQFECAPAEGGFASCMLTRLREPLEATCLIEKTLEEGERCDMGLLAANTVGYCRLPLLCDEERGVCVRPAERGERCVTGPQNGDTCAPGSVCDRLGTQRCVAPAPIGSPCDPSGNLCEGFACRLGQCREPLFFLNTCES